MPGCGPEGGRRHRKDLADGLVELAHAAESGGKGDVRDFHGGGDQQGAGGLGAARPRQGQRAGAEFVAEDPVELARGVAEPGRQPLDAVAVDHAVIDQPHGPAGDIGAHVPGRRAGHGLGQAAFARTVAGVVRSQRTFHRT